MGDLLKFVSEKNNSILLHFDFCHFQKNVLTFFAQFIEQLIND
jgi:hypothetical protein